MIDCTRLTDAEKDVLREALRFEASRQGRRIVQTENLRVEADAKWRRYVTLDLIEQLERG